MVYIAPTVSNGEIEVEINDEDMASELQFWENALIMYVMGEDLSMRAIKNFMQKMWNFVQLPDLYYHDEGYFILRFKNSEDMDVVLMKGQYSIRGMSVLIKECNPEFNLKKIFCALYLFGSSPNASSPIMGSYKLEQDR